MNKIELDIEVLSQPIVYPRPNDTTSYIRNPCHKTDIFVQSDYPDRDAFYKIIQNRIKELRLDVHSKLLDLKILMDGWSIYGLMGYIDYIQLTQEQINLLKFHHRKLIIFRSSK